MWHRPLRPYRRCTVPRGSPDRRGPRWRRTARARRASDQAGHDWSDSVDKHSDAALVRVEPVTLIELGLHRDTIEKKRIERHVINGRQLRKDLIESTFVILSKIRRGGHSEGQKISGASIDLLQHLCYVLAY